MANAHFSVDYAKRATSSCKKCKTKIEAQQLRLAKIVPNHFSESGGDMKLYYHPQCLFDSFASGRTAKVIESAEDVENWTDLNQGDKELLLSKIDVLAEKRHQRVSKKRLKSKSTSLSPVSPPKQVKILPADELQPTTSQPKLQRSDTKVEKSEDSDSDDTTDWSHRDNSWSQFCILCRQIASVGSYKSKTERVSDLFHKDSFRGNVYYICKLLLPMAHKRVYNINSKQILKYFSDILCVDLEDMQQHLNESGDVSDTIKHFFEEGETFSPCKSSALNLKEVDDWLNEMTQYTKESDKIKHLKFIAKRCTSEDLTFIIRQLKHDLRINAGPKHILEALNKNAYSAFQASRNLKAVVRIALTSEASMSVQIELGVPVLPMLAQQCKSVEQAIKHCPRGMFVEIKYDGERVQVHKQQSSFTYFSRSLKPVQQHKISEFKDWLPKAFPKVLDLVLDSEVLMVELKTGKPLPFGSLGKHKKEAFKDSSLCLFIFDCIWLNGCSLMHLPLKERKQILQDNISEIPNKVMLSQTDFVDNEAKLRVLIKKAIEDGLEGLMLKCVDSVYEPGKRHWLKVKKDYLAEGSMADSADLIVLGAFYGTGNKGGLMSVFLMGCYDAQSACFRTVTKCGNGFDDAALDKVNKEMRKDMVKISRNFNLVPSWLKVSRQLVPDFVVSDPKKSPVFEIGGAEFTKSEVHTADGISIRFPRVIKIRHDKDWKTATSLEELKNLVQISKGRTDLLGFGEENQADEDEEVSENDQAECVQQSGSSSSSPSSRSRLSPAKRTAKKKVDKIEAIVKQPCKYGSKCYRKNAKHLEEFSHPGDGDAQLSNNDSSSDDSEVAEIFQEFVFFIDKSVRNASQLKRVIALNGGEVSDVLDHNVTHAVVQKLPIEEGDWVQVTPNWIKDCVNLHKLPPTEKQVVNDGFKKV